MTRSASLMVQPLPVMKVAGLREAGQCVHVPNFQPRADLSGSHHLCHDHLGECRQISQTLGPCWISSHLSFLSPKRRLRRMRAQLFLGLGPISLIVCSVFSSAMTSKWYLTEKGAHQTRDRILIKRAQIISGEMDSQARSGAL